MNLLVEKAHAASLTDKLNDLTLFKIVCKRDDLTAVSCTIERVISWIFTISGLLVFAMVIYSAIIYLTSYGEESKIELAKKTLTWSVIGVIVIILARSVIQIIGNLFKS